MPSFLVCELLPVSATVLSILILAIFSSSTVAVAVTEFSPFVRVSVYSPFESFAVATNLTDVLSSLHANVPATSVSPFLIVTEAVAACALSNTASNVSAFTALKLVIAPSV